MKANQGPDTFQTLTADKAVDGDTSNTEGKCAYTTVGSPAWWRVDLGKRVLVTGLKLYNRAKGRMFLPFSYILFMWFYPPSLCYGHKSSMGTVRCVFY